MKSVPWHEGLTISKREKMPLCWTGWTEHHTLCLLTTCCR